MITVVGLGVEKGDLTEKGKQAIKHGERVLVGTAKAKSYENILGLHVEHTCLDNIYEKSRSYKTLYKNLAKAVLDAGDGTVYCVDGAASEDNSVKELSRRLKDKLYIIDGVSKINVLVRKANFKECSYQAVSAYELEKGRLNAPLLVYDMHDKELAGDVKLALIGEFGEETRVKYIDGGLVKEIPLFELDRQESYSRDSAVAIEKRGLLEKKRFDTTDLKEIIERLRKPDGCPWDKVQTPESIKMNAVEEAYELVDAIDKQDDEKVLEETGDILLQAMFHAVMKEETGAFDWSDVTSGICEKLITRHTHIFGADKATDETSALSVWEKNKMKEKHQETFSAAIDDVPKVFPALLQAQKVLKRAEKGGWKIAEKENAEGIRAALERLESGDKKALGEILLRAVQSGRAAGLDAEEVLLETVKAFADKYRAFETAVTADGKDVNALSKAEKRKYLSMAENA